MIHRLHFSDSTNKISATGHKNNKPSKVSSTFLDLVVIFTLFTLVQLPITDYGIFQTILLSFQTLDFIVLLSVFYCLLLSFLVVWTIKTALFFCPKVANYSILSFATVIAIVNRHLFIFRANPFQWNDFSGISTAADVAGQYSLQFDSSIGWTLVLFLLGIFMLRTFHQYLSKCANANLSTPSKNTYFITKKNIAHKFCPIKLSFQLIALSIIWSILWLLPVEDVVNANPDYCGDGEIFVANMFLQAKANTIKEPDQYEEKIETILTNYVSDSLSDATYTTDIIVIMNETYSDLRMYDSSESIPQTPSISFTENVYSFLDEISANSLSGTVQVPVYGGTTANSEFEFLMGTSLIFRADTPYQTVFNDLDEDTLQNGSLVTVMEMLGYETGALHPSQPSAWNREVVYSKMGFDSAYFLEDLTYSEEDLDRDWIMRDACDYDNVLKILEENTSDSPSFIFNVTIQNHGGYSTAPDTSAIVQIEGQEGSFSDAENYLSLIYDSDLATADFLAALEARERPSIVVFFGDHGPGLKNDFYQWATGEEFDLSDSLHYQTPFFIWSSQGNLEGDLDHVSLNYLSTILFNSLDLPQTGYQKFLNDLYTQYPVVNNHLLMNTAGNELDYEETLENSQLLQLYEAIAYNQLEENGAGLEDFYIYAE